jgi:hypothetical protein
MAKEIHKMDTVYLIDGTPIRMGPLKIRFLKEFMNIFDLVEFAKDDDQSMMVLSECATVCMRQYYPIIQTREELEDSVNLPTIYKILDVCAGIKINPDKEDIEKQAKEQSEDNTWDKLDLASLEAEVFLIGAWKNFDELENSITMPELIAILEKTRELDYNEKKFLAAMQGVDLDKHSGKQDAWEKMKAKVFSGGGTSDPSDILALQGVNAQKAGFGIGMGLSYEKL